MVNAWRFICCIARLQFARAVTWCTKLLYRGLFYANTVCSRPQPYFFTTSCSPPSSTHFMIASLSGSTHFRCNISRPSSQQFVWPGRALVVPFYCILHDPCSRHGSTLHGLPSFIDPSTKHCHYVYITLLVDWPLARAVFWLSELQRLFSLRVGR